MEDIIAHFCFSCGKSVPEKAKFCPFCGEHIQIEEASAPEKPIVILPRDHPQEEVNKNFTLLSPGDEFCGYQIIRQMNKDAEGIKYITSKDDKEYVLKVFFKSSFQNMNTLFGLQTRLSRLNHLTDARTAKVVEVNQSHSPAYMAVEYIHGVSLAEVKRHNPNRLNEKLVRELALQLIKTTIAIRKHGLTISNLNLTGIMLNDKEELVVLSSGITYEDTDEREDIFILGVILAQLLSKNTLFASIYDAERLKTVKFTNISGVSLAFNKALAEALHRNVTQRYPSLQKFYEAVESLPDIGSDEVWKKAETGTIENNEPTDDVIPKMRIEYGFWALVIVVIGLIVLLFTTNVYSVLFGTKGDKLQYTGFSFGDSDAEKDTLTTMDQASAPRDARRDIPRQTNYGEMKSNSSDARIDPRRLPETTNNTNNTPTPTKTKTKPSSGFVYIAPSTFGFGRLGENLAHNVSLSGFYISKHEVTQGEWNRFMKPANTSTVGDNLPVDNVSWFDIAIYCNGRSEAEGLKPAYKIRGVGASRVITCDFNTNGYRLPTEAEWELAAKAGELNSYSGSDDATDVAWFRDNSAGKIRSGGNKTANNFGIYDMSGNVSEWVWDWYDANYLKALPTFINPTGPQAGTQKSIRGGNVMNGEGRNLNIMWREKGDPNRGYQYVGFRLVRTH